MLIMRHVSVSEKDACQVQKGRRYDEAGHPGDGRGSHRAFWLKLASAHPSLR
jgi:hypothetical protein